MQTHAKNIKYFYKQKHAKWANAASWQNAADLLCKRLIPNINKWQIFLLVNSKGACLSFDISANSRLKTWLSCIWADFNGRVIKKLACQKRTSEHQSHTSADLNLNRHLRTYKYDSHYTKGMIRVLKWNWYFAFRKKTFQEIIKLILKCIMLEICTPEYNNCTWYLQKGTFIPEFTEEEKFTIQNIWNEVNIWKDWRFYNGQTLVQMYWFPQTDYKTLLLDIWVWCKHSCHA